VQLGTSDCQIQKAREQSKEISEPPASANSKQQRQNYRPEIDGLRALAIIAVIINHIHAPFLPSGYLGVDIFFVISGYVITSSLKNYKTETLASFLKEFYARRFKRILPALICYTTIIGLLISFVEPHPRSSLLTGLTGLFGSSNLYLFRQSTDYFASQTTLNPFANTWSLGVEEQFYLIAPLVLWHTCAASNKQLSTLRVTAALMAASVTSYIIFGWLLKDNLAAAYFLLPGRFWELALGSITYLNLSNKKTRKNWPAIISLIFILCALNLPQSWQLSSTTIVTCMTALALTVIRPGTMPYNLLANSFTVGIGRRSYSLYLWHWGILSLCRWTIGINLYTIPLIILLIAATTSASYAYIEEPIRNSKWPKRHITTISAAVTSLCLSSIPLLLLIFPFKNKSYMGQRPKLSQIGVESLVNKYTIYGTKGTWNGEKCVLQSNEEANKKISLNDCHLGDWQKAKHRILVLGNSFSAAFVGSFESLVKDHDYAVAVTSSWGASPVEGIKNNGIWSTANNHYWNHIAPELINQLKPNDWVLLISDLSGYSPGQETGKTLIKLNEFKSKLAKFSAKLQEKQLRLGIVDGLPFTREAKCDPSMAIQQWFNPFGPPCLLYSHEQSLERRKALHLTLVNLQKQKLITVIDLFNIFCHGKICGYEGPHGTVLYRDIFSHPSMEAARISSRIIKIQILRSNLYSP